MRTRRLNRHPYSSTTHTTTTTINSPYSLTPPHTDHYTYIYTLTHHFNPSPPPLPPLPPLPPRDSLSLTTHTTVPSYRLTLSSPQTPSSMNTHGPPTPNVNLMIVGRAGSGKSIFIREFVPSLYRHHIGGSQYPENTDAQYTICSTSIPTRSLNLNISEVRVLNNYAECLHSLISNIVKEFGKPKVNSDPKIHAVVLILDNILGNEVEEDFDVQNAVKDLSDVTNVFVVQFIEGHQVLGRDIDGDQYYTLTDSLTLRLILSQLDTRIGLQNLVEIKGKNYVSKTSSPKENRKTQAGRSHATSNATLQTHLLLDNKEMLTLDERKANPRLHGDLLRFISSDRGVQAKRKKPRKYNF